MSGKTSASEFQLAAAWHIVSMLAGVLFCWNVFGNLKLFRTQMIAAIFLKLYTISAIVNFLYGSHLDSNYRGQTKSISEYHSSKKLLLL